MTWMFYDPTDASRRGGFSTLPTSSTALTAPFDLGKNMPKKPRQGRYTVRCIALNDKHEPVVYADETFFVWTSKKRMSETSHTELKKVIKNPSGNSFSEVGAAHARSMMLEHHEAIKKSGTGSYEGNQVATPTAGVTQTDCTEYVLDVLGKTFAAKGLGADWTKIYSAARKGSGKKFKGTELLEALVNVGGWKAVFWSPDPSNPEDKKPEHPTAYRNMVKAKGSYYDIPVDNTKSVINYRRTSPTAQEEWTRLDQLRQVPFAVIAARGGSHMTLLINGVVYEVHWDKPATDPDVIEAQPLEKWEWQSGVVVMPPESFKKEFK